MLLYQPNVQCQFYQFVVEKAETSSPISSVQLKFTTYDEVFGKV